MSAHLVACTHAHVHVHTHVADTRPCICPCTCLYICLHTHGIGGRSGGGPVGGCHDVSAGGFHDAGCENGSSIGAAAPKPCAACGVSNWSTFFFGSISYFCVQTRWRWETSNRLGACRRLTSRTHSPPRHADATSCPLHKDQNYTPCPTLHKGQYNNKKDHAILHAQHCRRANTILYPTHMVQPLTSRSRLRIQPI